MLFRVNLFHQSSHDVFCFLSHDCVLPSFVVVVIVVLRYLAVRGRTIIFILPETSYRMVVVDGRCWIIVAGKGGTVM